MATLFVSSFQRIEFESRPQTELVSYQMTIMAIAVTVMSPESEIRTVFSIFIAEKL